MATRGINFDDILGKDSCIVRDSDVKRARKIDRRRSKLIADGFSACYGGLKLAGLDKEAEALFEVPKKYRKKTKRRK